MLRRLRSLLKVDRQAAEIAKAAALRAFQATFQLTPLKRRPGTFVWRDVFFFNSFSFFSTQAPCRLHAIRWADAKVFGASARLHFWGTTAPIDQSAQTCPGPSPPMHHGAACWSQKSLTTTNISAATACLPLISCREIFLEYPSPFEEGEERKPHPSPPQSPGNYSQTHSSFLLLPPCCTSSAGCLSVVALPLHSASLTVSAQILLTLQPLHILEIQYLECWHSKMFHYGLIENSRVAIITVGNANTKQHNMTPWPQSFQQLENLWLKHPFFSWLTRLNGSHPFLGWIESIKHWIYQF